MTGVIFSVTMVSLLFLTGSIFAWMVHLASMPKNEFTSKAVNTNI